MYAQISPELRSLNLVVERLKTENRAYATRYPAAQATTTSSAEAFERTSKQGELLFQQIAMLSKRHRSDWLHRLLTIIDKVSLLSDSYLYHPW
jgi:hypothetical protein